jgi:hypothetical protein
MKKIYFVYTILCILCVVSCEKENETTEISDENFYKEIGIALVDCYTDIYNQNLAGKSTGDKNLSANGPMGGTVNIKGNTSYDNTHGITMTDLVFTMDKVKYTYTNGSGDNTWITEIKLTGATTYSGSFSSTYTSVNHQSENLYISGIVTKGGSSRKIDMSGNVNINRSTKISVNIFGNSVSW